MTYFDANVFIYPLIYEETLADAAIASGYLEQLVRGQIIGYTCTLTWDEIFYIVLQKSGHTQAVTAGEAFLNFPNLQFINVDHELITKAQEIARDFNVKPRDAIHAASALKRCNGEIISNDSGFDVIDGINRMF